MAFQTVVKRHLSTGTPGNESWNNVAGGTGTRSYPLDFSVTSFYGRAYTRTVNGTALMGFTTGQSATAEFIGFAVDTHSSANPNPAGISSLQIGSGYATLRKKGNLFIEIENASQAQVGWGIEFDENGLCYGKAQGPATAGRVFIEGSSIEQAGSADSKLVAIVLE